jgi:hypothetical protein
MIELYLRVTKAVIEQVARSDANQRQIAVPWSHEVEQVVGYPSKNKPVKIRVAGLFELLMGDTGAIWSSHQHTAQQVRNFDLLYELLSQYPDQAATFDLRF